MLHEPTLMPDKAGTVTDQRDRAFLPMEALTQLESDHEPLVPWMFQQLSQAHSRLAHVIECATGSQMRAALRMERRRKRLETPRITRCLAARTNSSGMLWPPWIVDVPANEVEPPVRAARPLVTAVAPRCSGSGPVVKRRPKGAKTAQVPSSSLPLPEESHGTAQQCRRGKRYRQSSLTSLHGRKRLGWAVSSRARE